MKHIPAQKISSFADIEEEFIERVHSTVWCNMATVDTRDRPRSRVLHPIWEGSTGWIATGRKTLKARHLARNSHVSLAYVANPLKPTYADCVAEWNDDPAQKERIWNLFLSAPPPLGYDLSIFFGSHDNPEYGLLELSPWRLELAQLPGQSRVWLAKSSKP